MTIDEATKTATHSKLNDLHNNLHKVIVGQKKLIESLLICLLCDGHVLIEGMPGLAKTTAAKVLAASIAGKFHRIQFTPDLLPADLIGTDIFLPDKQEFSFKQGPIFQNILLADEVNRAPAKVQSALLEAMEEKQVTVGQISYALPELFMVIATQNPIDQEGTYNLPEAQLDRFLMQVNVTYPSHKEELEILTKCNSKAAISKTTAIAEITQARIAVNNVYLDQKLLEYIVSMVQASRFPDLYDKKLAELIKHGASPRASKALAHCAKAYAWLHDAKYVLPEHIHNVLPNILRHRIARSFVVQADNISKDYIIEQLVKLVAIP